MKIFQEHKPTEFRNEILADRIQFLEKIVEAILTEIANSKKQDLSVVLCPTIHREINKIEFIWKDKK